MKFDVYVNGKEGEESELQFRPSGVSEYDEIYEKGREETEKFLSKRSIDIDDLPHMTHLARIKSDEPYEEIEEYTWRLPPQFNST